MSDRRLGRGIQGMCRGVGLALVVASGCSQQEELAPDPGVSPFYPGPSAAAKEPAGGGSPASRSATANLKLDRPLRPEDMERQLRLALRAADRGDFAGAIPVLDRILAMEPVHREALAGRAAIALDQAKSAASPEARDAELEKAATLVRTLRRAYEKPNQRELALSAAALFEQVRNETERGRLDRAVAALKEGYAAGFNAFNRIEQDEAFAKLRSFPGYLALVKTADEAELARARARVKNHLDHAPKVTLDFHLKDLDNRPLSLDHFKGKVVLVDVWGTWCGPCREAIPSLIQLYQKHRRRGFDIIGLDYEQNAPDPKTAQQQVKQFVKSAQIPYHIAMIDEATRQQLNVEAFPTTILIDRSGKPRVLLTGGGPEALAALDAATLVLLSEPAPGATQTGQPAAKPR